MRIPVAASISFKTFFISLLRSQSTCAAKRIEHRLGASCPLTNARTKDLTERALHGPTVSDDWVLVQGAVHAPRCIDRALDISVALTLAALPPIKGAVFCSTVHHSASHRTAKMRDE